MDDLQAGITSKEIKALQSENNLEEIQNTSVCSDEACCDPSPPPPDSAVEHMDGALGPTTPEDELMACRHLMKGPFGRNIYNKICLRAAHVEYALRKASMPTKGVTTSVTTHFENTFVNTSIQKYTEVLSQGREPDLNDFTGLPPPPDFEIWEPDSSGAPRRWGKPWKKNFHVSSWPV